MRPPSLVVLVCTYSLEKYIIEVLKSSGEAGGSPPLSDTPRLLLPQPHYQLPHGNTSSKDMPMVVMIVCALFLV